MIPPNIIKLAIQEAKASPHDSYKLGAVIFDGKRVISSGHNQLRSLRSFTRSGMKYPFSVHAEVHAIQMARHTSSSLKRKSILVVRVHPDNGLRLAKPCSFCMEYLSHVGITKVFFSLSEDPFFERLC